MLLPGVKDQSPFGRVAATVALVGAALLLLGTVYEALVAAKVIELGELPGEGAPGEGYVLASALIVMLLGVPLAVALTARPTALEQFAALLLASVAFVVARFLTFDPYYLPTLRRISDGGLLPAWWIVSLALLGVGMAVALRHLARLGLRARRGVPPPRCVHRLAHGHRPLMAAS